MDTHEKLPDSFEDDVILKTVLKDAAAVAEFFKVSEPVAVQLIGYALKDSDNFLEGKGVIDAVMAAKKKPIAKLTPNEIQMLLLVGYLAHKKQPFKAAANNTGRNEPCPCGSGEKYKKCCYEVARMHDVERYKNGR